MWRAAGPAARPAHPRHLCRASRRSHAAVATVQWSTTVVTSTTAASQFVTAFRSRAGVTVVLSVVTTAKTEWRDNPTRSQSPPQSSSVPTLSHSRFAVSVTVFTVPVHKRLTLCITVPKSSSQSSHSHRHNLFTVSASIGILEIGTYGLK